MNNDYSSFTTWTYFPFVNRGKSKANAFLPVLALCLVCIAPYVSAEQLENTTSGLEKKQLFAIKVADITEQAAVAEDRIQKIELELSEAGAEKQVVAALNVFEKELKTMQANLDKRIAGGFDKYDILEFGSSWDDLKNGLIKQQEHLKNRSDNLSNALESMHENKQVWHLTKRAVQHKLAPEAVTKRVTEILALQHQVQSRVKSSQNLTLDLLARASKLQDLVDLQIKRMEVAENKLVSNLFQAQALPLWSIEESKLMPSDIASRLKDVQAGLIKYVKDKHILLLIQLILTLFLGWFISRRYRLISEEKRVDNYALDSLRRPWAAAMLISVYMTPFLYQDRSLGFIFLTATGSLPLWLYVLRGMLPTALRVSLTVVALIALVEQVRSAFGGFSLLSRLTLIVEFIIALAALHWLLPASFQHIPDSLRNSFWYKFLRIWLRYSVPLLAAGIVVVTLGYSELADKMAFLLIWGPVAGASFIAIVRVTEALLQSYIDMGHFDFMNTIRINRHPFVTLTRRILRVIGFFAWAYLVLRAILLLNPVRDVTNAILTAQLGIDPVTFSLWGILAFGFTLWFSWQLARFVNLVLNNEIFSRMRTPPGVPFAITTFSRYIILVAGFFAAVSILGFSLDKITIVLGALGVGIGFGLQNITNNFVSGIILLFERPIRVGDKIQLDDLIGRVSSIGIRASKITSFEGSDVIVPNADFISSRVINWTFSDEKRRVILPVGVSYATDPEEVLELLLNIAKAHPEIIASPEPEALFQGFGESSLNFELRAWTESGRGWVTVKSDLTLIVHKALKDAGINIPFPQRDVNLRNIPGLQQT